MKNASVPTIAFCLLLAAPGVDVVSAQADQQAPAGDTSPGKTPPVEAAGEASAPTPLPISFADIPTAMEEASDSLTEIRGHLMTDEEMTELVSQIDDMREKVVEEQQLSGHADLTHLSFARIERFRLLWTRHGTALTDLQKRLRNEASALDADIKALESMTEVWTLTRQSLEEDEARAALQGGIDSLLAEIAKTSRKASNRLRRLITLQNRVTALQGTVKQALTRIQAAETGPAGSLLVPDQRPIWRVFAEEPGRPSLIVQLKDTWSANILTLREFAASHSTRGIFHGLLFVALYLVMRKLRSVGRSMSSGDPALAESVRILERPASASLLLVLLAARWIYPDRPLVFVEILLMVAFVPLLRLLLTTIPSSARWPIYGLGVLFLLDRIRQLTSERTIPGRFVLLAVTVAGLMGLFLIRRRGEGWSQRWMRKGFLWTATLALALALLANITGNVNLAKILSQGVVLGAYFGMGLLAAYLVLFASLQLLFRTAPVRQVRFVRVYAEQIQKRTLLLLRIGAALWWVTAIMNILMIRDPVFAAVTGVLDYRMSIGQIGVSLGNVMAFVVTLLIAVIASHLIRIFLEEDVLTRIRLPRGVAGTISMMVRYGIITLGFLLAAAAAGLQMSQFAFIVGALGVGIGFGLQNVVNNFVSGLILAFERPIQIGDTITTGTLMGTVRNIGIRSSTLRTFEGAEVIVPNGNLLSSEVVNWTLSDRQRRIEVAIGVAYGSDLRAVRELLEKEASAHEKVMKNPAPVALFQGFGESSLDFSLRFWTANFDDWLAIGSDVGIAVNEALAEAKIVIPFPQRDLHIKSTVKSSGGGDSAGDQPGGSRNSRKSRTQEQA